MKAMSIDRWIRGSRSDPGNTFTCSKREEDPPKDLEKEESVREGKPGVRCKETEAPAS